MSTPAREDTVAYLLGELSEPERAAFEARLTVELDLRVEVEALRPMVDRLERMGGAWDAPAAPPPPAVPEAGVTPRTPRARPAGGRRRALAVWGLATAACVLVLLVVVSGALTGGENGDTPADPQGREIALLPIGSGRGASGRIRLGSDEAVVKVEGLAPAAAGDYYELWMLSTPTDLVSLGSFRVSADGHAEVRVPVPFDPRAFRYLDVSLEPGDGDPSHSKRSVLRASTRS